MVVVGYLTLASASCLQGETDLMVFVFLWICMLSVCLFQQFIIHFLDETFCTTLNKCFAFLSGLLQQIVSTSSECLSLHRMLEALPPPIGSGPEGCWGWGSSELGGVRGISAFLLRCFQASGQGDLPFTPLPKAKKESSRVGCVYTFRHTMHMLGGSADGSPPPSVGGQRWQLWRPSRKSPQVDGLSGQVKSVQLPFPQSSLGGLNSGAGCIYSALVLGKRLQSSSRLRKECRESKD